MAMLPPEYYTLELVTEAPAELKTSGEYDRILA